MTDCVYGNRRRRAEVTEWPEWPALASEPPRSHYTREQPRADKWLSHACRYVQTRYKSTIASRTCSHGVLGGRTGPWSGHPAGPTPRPGRPMSPPHGRPSPPAQEGPRPGGRKRRRGGAPSPCGHVLHAHTVPAPAAAMGTLPGVLLWVWDPCLERTPPPVHRWFHVRERA